MIGLVKPNILCPFNSSFVIGKCVNFISSRHSRTWLTILDHVVSKSSDTILYPSSLVIVNFMRPNLDVDHWWYAWISSSEEIDVVFEVWEASLSSMVPSICGMHVSVWMVAVDGDWIWESKQRV